MCEKGEGVCVSTVAERERESQRCNLEVRSNIKKKRREKFWSGSQAVQIPVKEEISK